MRRVSLRLSDANIARLKLIARRKGVNFGQLARRVLDDVPDPDPTIRRKNRETVTP
jgi:predicted DNA binding CopG/RHH family protein